jgi:HEPN domain-containing protein
MNVQINKNAVLFLKALEDVWVAEQIWKGSPNNAAWHCTQAVEKTLKGFLQCLNRDFDHGHELTDLLDCVERVTDLPPEIAKHILYIDRFGVALRYKSMSSDPTTDEAHMAINRTKEIMQEFGNNPKVSNYMKEAIEVHAKLLKAISDQDS